MQGDKAVERLAIFARAIKPPEEKREPENEKDGNPKGNPSSSDPWVAVAKLISDLQDRIEKLEKKPSKPKVSRRRIEHVRDPKTNQIVSSIIIDEEE